MSASLLSVDAARAGVIALLPAQDRVRTDAVPTLAAAGRVVSQDVLGGGKIVVAERATIGAWDLPRLDELGITELPCLAVPRVALVANGNELVDVGVEPGDGQVVDAATPALAAALRAVGAAPVLVRRAKDSTADIRRALREAAEADLVVSVAGVSVGDHDLVRGVVAELGAIDFWRVAMRPGKPLAVGRVLGRPFIGLPGNPVSALVGFEVFVLPAVLALQGRAGWGRPTVTAQLAADVVKPDGLRTYPRVRLEARPGSPPLAYPVLGQRSFQLRWLANSDALLDLPEAGPGATAGTRVEAVLINRPVVPPAPA